MTVDDPLIPFVDLPAQHADLKPALLAVVEKALHRAAFIGGEAVARFEEDFAAFCGVEHCVGVSSGTDALRLTLLALGLQPGDVVATVPNTFIATTEAITQAGGVIEFVDIDPHDCLMDLNQLEDLLRRKSRQPGSLPKFVIPVHLYGQCADIDGINALAAKYEFKVLEDAAQAHGALLRERPAGSLGDAAAFSFYPGKNLGACGEAGAVTTSDPEVAGKVASLRDHGQVEKYNHQAEGWNARLDALQAGFLSVKLPYLARWNQKRRNAAEVYDRAFSSLPGIDPVVVRDYNLPSRHLYVIHTPDRDGLKSWLEQHNIQTGLHYPCSLHLQPCYQHLCLGPGSFPHAEESAQSLLSLPLFPEITDEQLSRVVETVRAFEER